MRTFTQEIVDHHCKMIRAEIQRGQNSGVECLNWMKNNASSIITRKNWQWVGACLVMHGWLTVDENNNFQIKEKNL